MRQTLVYLVANDNKCKVKFSLRLQYMLLGDNMGREFWHNFSQNINSEVTRTRRLSVLTTSKCPHVYKYRGASSVSGTPAHHINSAVLSLAHFTTCFNTGNNGRLNPLLLHVCSCRCVLHKLSRYQDNLYRLRMLDPVFIIKLFHISLF